MTRKPTPAVPNRPGRAVLLAQGLDVITLLRERPMRAVEISDALGMPIRTVNRVLAGLDKARPQIDLRREVRAKERYYSLPRDTLRKAVP